MRVKRSPASILMTVLQGQPRKSEFKIYLEEIGDKGETCLDLLALLIMKQGAIGDEVFCPQHLIRFSQIQELFLKPLRCMSL